MPLPIGDVYDKMPLDMYFSEHKVFQEHISCTAAVLTVSFKKYVSLAHCPLKLKYFSEMISYNGKIQTIIVKLRALKSNVRITNYRDRKKVLKNAAGCLFSEWGNEREFLHSACFGVQMLSLIFMCGVCMYSPCCSSFWQIHWFSPIVYKHALGWSSTFKFL